MVLPFVGLALAGARGTDAVGGVTGPTDLTLRPTAPDAGTPVVITHHELRFDVMSLGVAPTRVDVALRDGLGSEATGGAAFPSLDAWATARVATSSLCGTSAEVGWTLQSAGSADDPVHVERVRFGGDVCPQFVDTDADGRCPQGLDLDHDGLCVSPGEVVESGTMFDCNDTARGPACIGLTVEQSDADTRLVATGAPPGELLWFFGSPRRGQSCPPVLGGVCVDLAMPRMLGNAEVDPEGTARLVVHGPPTGFYQAGVLGLTMDSDFSAAIAASGAVTVPEPATEP